MKILIAPDSFKHSLTALEAANVYKLYKFRLHCRVIDFGVVMNLMHYTNIEGNSND